MSIKDNTWQPEAKVNILLVDHQPKNMLVLEALLDSLSQPLVKAYSGREALECLLKQEFAVILLNVEMPEMDGFKTARLIRQRPTLQDTPIIFLAAIEPDETYVHMAYSLGVVDYLVKPIKPEILLSKVNTFISLFKKTQEAKQHAAQLEVVIKQLEREIAEHKRIEAALRQAHKVLKNKVREQTAQLIRTNEVLRAEIAEYKQTEDLHVSLAVEQELRKLQLRFFAMTSHEFRTPLTSILAGTQLLETCAQNWPEEKRRRNLRRIKTAVKRMIQLLDDILIINRAETRKLELNPQPINLEKFCQNLLEELRLNTNSNHQVTFRVKGQCCRVILDQDLLYSILTNLLSNAIKYSQDDGEINLALSCEKEEITFQIKDQGIGIPVDDKRYLFEPFFRGKNVGNIPGAGLGITVVKKCLDLQGGKISLHSEEGTGTTVTVTIPLLRK